MPHERTSCDVVSCPTCREDDRITEREHAWERVEKLLGGAVEHEVEWCSSTQFECMDVCQGEPEEGCTTAYINFRIGLIDTEPEMVLNSLRRCLREADERLLAAQVRREFA